MPTLLGYAWLPTLLAGLIMVIGGRLARKRMVSTWYWEKPGNRPAVARLAPRTRSPQTYPQLGMNHTIVIRCGCGRNELCK